MTANQIAFQRAKEEARANRRKEELEAYGKGIEAKKAQASMRSANASYLQALMSQREQTRKMDESASQKFANVGSGIGGIAKGLSAFASLFF